VRIFKRIIFVMLVFNMIVVLSGCGGNFSSKKKNIDYDFPEVETQWIRDGEPIKFEEGLWYPQDNVDILLDAEVYSVAEYRDIEVFVGKVDVRPYEQLYTKFGRNKFRSFKKRK